MTQITLNTGLGTQVTGDWVHIVVTITHVLTVVHHRESEGSCQVSVSIICCGEGCDIIDFVCIIIEVNKVLGDSVTRETIVEAAVGDVFYLRREESRHHEGVNNGLGVEVLHITAGVILVEGVKLGVRREDWRI